VAADVVFKDFFGQGADAADGEIQGMVGNAADGNGRFAVFGNGDLKELARFYRVRIAAVIGHAEGIFHIGVFDDL